MDANDILSGVKYRTHSILTDWLRNFSKEVRISIEGVEKEEGIKINECDKLSVILKSLKDIPRKMAVELIKNSSLNDRDKILLNISYGNPRVAILLPPIKTTEEEVLGDELLISDKTLAEYKLSEHLPPKQDTPEEIDRYFLH